jgi:predicted nucleic acid-binding protein
VNVLVDTSVWVNHFRSSNSHLEDLLGNTEVVCHPLVIGELACGNLKNRQEILALLGALPMAREVEHEEALEFIEDNKLMGKGIGFIDIVLLASSRLSAIPIWTNDRKLKEAAQELKTSYKHKRS